MHNLKLYPYQMGSESAKELARLLDIKRVHADGDYVPRLGHVILNWGTSRLANWSDLASRRNVRVLNKPAAVKLTTLQALRNAGVATPDFTTDRRVAMNWFLAGETIVERHTLGGNSGEGIRIVNRTAGESYVHGELSMAPLYTKFIPKTSEFRVHVFNGQVVDYVEKKRQAAERRPENFNRHVSSVNLGWVFARTNIMDNPEVKQLAIRAVTTLGLDFGAVDVVYYEGRPYVLEVNTAPGLGGTTLVRYVNAFRRYMGVGDLSQDVVNQILTQNGETLTPAAVGVRQEQVAPITARPVLNGDDVILRLDRTTALKLKSLLALIN